MEPVRAILLHDMDGTKLDSAAKSALRRMFPRATPHSLSNVLRGELLLGTKENPPFNYVLSRDSSVYLFCDEIDVAPLYGEDFSLLVAIKKPSDRLNAFTNKLEWGSQLKEGVAVHVTVRGPNLSVEESVRAVIHYKGEIGDVPGIQFGVEIMEEKYRKSASGTTDGIFQNTRYFNCADGCGLFVSLHLISSGAFAYKHGHSRAISCDDSKTPPQCGQTRPNMAENSGLEPPKKDIQSVFKQGQRVKFYDMDGDTHYGGVHWTGRETSSKKFDYPVVGIKTDEGVFFSDFEYSILGMSHLVKKIPIRHALFLPEALVEDASKQGEGLTQSQSTNKNPKEMRGKNEVLDQTKITAEDQAGIKALVAAEESVNLVEQQKAYKKFAEIEAKKQYSVEVAQGRQYERAHGEGRENGRGRGKLEHGHSHSNRVQHQASNRHYIYEDVESVSGPFGGTQQVDEHRHLHPPEKARGARQQFSGHTDVKWVPENRQHHPKSQYPVRPERPYMDAPPFNQDSTVTDQDQPFHANTGTSGDDAFNLTEGSLIQIPAPDPHHPMTYGTIRWIGILPNVNGRIAGIELNEFMEGCSDGTYPPSNRKFFTCPPGKGLYYPLENLHSDERYQRREQQQENAKQDAAQIEELREEVRKKQLIIQAQKSEIAAKDYEIQRKVQEIAALQQKVKASEISEQQFMHFTQIQSSTDNVPSWSIPRSQIQSITKREIGRGAWGVVYSGTFRGECVAIKQAHREILHTGTINILKREVLIMAHIQHPNLVRFIAAVFDDAVINGIDIPIIVSELMDMNLRAAYHRFDLSSSLISIFCDVAYALHYLHQHRQPIIHRDVSAPNVLLKTLRNGTYQAKVSDFGSANLVKQANTAATGAIVYCAPEMFPTEDVTAPPEPQTTKVDIFSYGILMLEVIVKEMPTRETRYTMFQRVSHQWKMMYELIIHCTRPLPSDRPTMAYILNKLNPLLH